MVKKEKIKGKKKAKPDMSDWDEKPRSMVFVEEEQKVKDVQSKSKFSLEGWNIWQYLKGRKKLLVTMIGGIATFIVTNKPEYAAMAAAGAELLYAIFDYFIKEA